MANTGDGMPPDANELIQPALAVGHLQVKSSGLIRSSWKQRWYELRGSTLYYFKTPEGKPSGRIPLEGCILEPDASNPLRFSLTSRLTARRYEFQADTAQHYDTWVNKLTECISQSGDGGGSPQRKSVFNTLVNLKLFEKKDEEGKKPVSIDDFELLSVLGKGSYGKVLKVRKKDTQELLALKIMRKDSITKPKEVMSERAVLQLVDHPFVVKLVNAFQTPSKLFLVLTYLPGGDLKHHLRQGTLFPEEKARFYAANILLAIEGLHVNKPPIIYRDLKPENIVLDVQGYAVLTDMGLARHLTYDPMAYTFCGTPLYVAPEVLMNKGYTQAVDWWSYGIIVYEMLVGITPFAAKTAQAVFKLIMSRQPIIPDILSPNAHNLLSRLLVKNPMERLSEPSQIRAHPFFAGVNWDKLLRRQYAVPGGFARQRSASEKLQPDQVEAILAEIKADQSSSKYTPDTFQGFTFHGDGSDRSPVVQGRKK